MLGPFATASRRIAIHQVSLLSHAACASMSTTTTTTTTTRDSGDRYGPIEWAQINALSFSNNFFRVPPGRKSENIYNDCDNAQHRDFTVG